MASPSRKVRNVTLLGVVERDSVILSFSAAGRAKVGAAAGWVVGVASNISLVTVPASQTGSTVVIPLGPFKVGDKIKSFTVNGRINSAGGTVTLDADLRYQIPAAASSADASVAAMTQVSVIAQTLLSSANAKKTLSAEHTVVEGANYYLLVTATTAGSTDAAIHSVSVTVRQQ